MWECKKLHLKAMKPMCDILAVRDDTSLICSSCPNCPRQLIKKRKKKSSFLNEIDFTFLPFFCSSSKEVPIASSL